MQVYRCSQSTIQTKFTGTEATFGLMAYTLKHSQAMQITAQYSAAYLWDSIGTNEPIANWQDGRAMTNVCQS